MNSKELEIFIDDSLEKDLNVQEFMNGQSFIQQDPILIKSLKDKMTQHHKVKGFNTLGRILSNTGSHLYYPWCRLSNCDEQGREWDQFYYCENPNESAKCLNKQFKDGLIRLNRKRKIEQIEKKV